ncbi:MAG: helicase C-terminal domain-containing protein [Syntrophomonas sp.]|uniref:ATP-dependent DNA helicase n=1 Tax=Syntrophomonas sp. TaxID=2053627 RepID=UPI00260A612F|nr:helicase C-terminal domain-containing protein [Syntrophomonas sp.]MDD2509756.1 helicase C-terminal domain-containing protein [Syntrophomonas sp.]MDD3879504.1 helicase C-terminal domain-containing protein [Syntrophomonas sp.]MDD4625751.1 helicase C-terminal domain-containing protein [Syntrophomonas sp.]
MPVYPLDEIKNYFEPGGPMEQLLPDFRFRQEQVNLAVAVSAALSDQEFLLAEAGTGVGKTMAYLLPAVLWSLQENEKVVIATRTKALQQQLIERDLPDVKRVINADFTYAEAKGRENFLCWNKYINILAGKKSLLEGEIEFLQAVLPWAEQSPTGDKKELRLSSALMKHWGILAADRKSCRQEKCLYHEKCFRLKMIKRLEKSQIIISNHALLLSDVQVDNRILPEYHYLVVDEAHSLDREAFDKLSLRFSFRDTMELLEYLQKAQLPHIKGLYPAGSELTNECLTHISIAVKLLQGYFSALNRPLSSRNDYGPTLVIKTADLEKAWFLEALEIHQDWQDSINLLIKGLKKLEEEMRGVEDSEELSRTILSLEEEADYAFQITEEHCYQSDMLVWLDGEKGKVRTISSSPVCIASELQSRLYPKLESLVMVSATLAVEERFDYFLNKFGLTQLMEEERLKTLLEKSPFDYEKQAGYFLVDDMPAHYEPDYQEKLAGILSQIIDMTGGRTLILFTSRHQLKDIAGIIRPYCEQNQVKLLAQNEDGGFETLKEQYTNHSRSVIMGLDTFWEGIDLKGDLLKCLVIVKLPFRSPDEPFCQAWDKYYQQLNQSGFSRFLLPDAVIRLKQGAGRLIRSESDRGAIVVLDSRLGKSSYSKIFLNSLPFKNPCVLNRTQLIQKLGKWV